MADDTIPPADDQAVNPPADDTPTPPAGDDGGAPTGDDTPTPPIPAGKQYTVDDNQIIYDLVSLHPLTTFGEKEFINLLEHSLSLSVSEKKRVIDAVPTLSQYQVDELTKVFEDERIEFKKLMPKEGDTIKKLVVEKKAEWTQLKQIYIDELQAKKVEGQDQDQIDDIKAGLGI